MTLPGSLSMRVRYWLCGVLALALVVPAVASAVIFRPEPFPVTPTEGGRYPQGTWLTGPCDPEDPLPEPKQESLTRESTYSDFFLLPKLREPIAGVYPTGAKGQTSLGERNDGPCRAWHGGAAGEGSFEGYEGAIARSAVAHKVGQWRLVTKYYERRYECANPDPSGGPSCGPWTDLHEGRGVFANPTANFEIFDPCSFKIESVTNKRLVRVGTDAAIEGETVKQGNRILVRDEGSITLVGGDGVSVTLGPGEHRVERRPGYCKFSKVKPQGAVQGLVPIEVRDGKVTESFLDKSGRQLDEISAAIRGNPYVTYDGILSGIGPGSRMAAEDAPKRVTFTVTRSKRQKRTVACAVAGRLRIVSEKPKRTLIVPTGRCALTRDGRVPKLR